MLWAARNGRTVGSLVQPSSMVTNTTGSEVTTRLTTGGRPAPATSGGSGAGSPPWPVVAGSAAGAAEGAAEVAAEGATGGAAEGAAAGTAVWALARSAVAALRAA